MRIFHKYWSTKRFYEQTYFEYHMKWYKFYNNNLLVVAGSKQKGTLKLVNPKYEDWASVQRLTLSLLTFLFTLPRNQVIFSMKTKKRKVTKRLKCVKEFSSRFRLANEKYLSIFLRVFARIVKVTHFAQIINCPKRAHGKVHPRKMNRQIDKDGNRQISNNDKE